MIPADAEASIAVADLKRDRIFDVGAQLRQSSPKFDRLANGLRRAIRIGCSASLSKGR